MAVVSSTATREEKEKWLFRPLNWAYDVAVSGVIVGGLPFAFGDANSKVAAVILIACLVAVSGLILWGISRISKAARNQY